MSLLSFSTALLLLAAPAKPAPQGLQLHEGLPTGFKVDGKLDEWKLPASVTLGAANQVAGKATVTSPQDLSAQLWVAIGPEGLAVAGEVRDDQVHLSTKLDQVNHDHVELWLALPQPEMPPIAFVNQFGEQRVPTLAACENNEGIADGTPEDCRTWWKAQTENRKKLVRPFTVQYGLMSGSLVRFDQKAPVGSVHYVPMAGGYRFEALIPPAAFPRSAEAPLRTLRVLVDLVDSDEGKGKLETFLSSAKGRRFGDPSTFHAVTLSKPLRFGAWPELLERALKANASSSYQPAPDTQTLEVWVNPAAGYQYAPREPSPLAAKLDMSKEVPVAKLGDVELVAVPYEVNWTGGEDLWLISRRGKTLLDAARAGTSTIRTVQRPPGLYLLLVHEGYQSALGTGACGACPMLSFQLVTMNPQGRFSKPEELEGTYSQGEEITWEATPDLSRIQAFILLGEKEDTKHLSVRHTWDAKAGRYTEEKFERPPDPE
ncbi:MAG TPA: hypothetical protein VF815_31930 [Myxococcaceae bacterium]|jgi:hypothetical protein